MGLELTSIVHHCLDSLLSNATHLQRKEPVIQKNRGAHSNVSGEIVVGGRDLAVVCVVLWCKDHPLPRLEFDRHLQIPHADAGSLKVDQHRGSFATTLKHCAKLMDPTSSDLRSSMGRVNSHDVDPGIQQCGHLCGFIPGGPQGGNDFRAADWRARHAGV
jgi:hypothetical protein